MRGIVLLLGLLATPAMAADQFDLVCQGHYHERINAKWKPLERRYRIDISARSWCGGPCTSVEKIESVETGRIVFAHNAPDETSGRLFDHEVDRLTGEYVNNSYAGLSVWEEKGSCTPAPFSGFPATKF